MYDPWGQVSLSYARSFEAVHGTAQAYIIIDMDVFRLRDVNAG